MGTALNVETTTSCRKDSSCNIHPQRHLSGAGDAIDSGARADIKVRGVWDDADNTSGGAIFVWKLSKRLCVNVESVANYGSSDGVGCEGLVGTKGKKKGEGYEYVKERTKHCEEVRT